MSAEGDTRSRMDRMYRLQRHFYDLTRKFFLFGRDTLIRSLKVLPGENMCEVGCGTARNLVILARKNPQARFFGVDASAEMLRTANAHVERARLGGRVRLAPSLATDLDGGRLFGLTQPFDRLLYSYCLSMMDDWRAALAHGITQLKPGGTLYIVDFGDQKNLPRWFKKLLGAWLDKFHVRFRPELRDYFAACERAGKGRMTYREIMRGYAYLLTFEIAV